MKMEHHIFSHQTKKNYTNQRIYENGGAHRKSIEGWKFHRYSIKIVQQLSTGQRPVSKIKARTIIDG